MSLLSDRQACVELGRQMLSEVDLQTIKSGSIDHEIDEFMHDAIKVQVRASGLVNRLGEKNQNQANRIRELVEKNNNLEEQNNKLSEQIKELEEIDRSRYAKMEDIERQFQDIRSSASALVLKLQESMEVGKEGVAMMAQLGEKFKENCSKLSDLEVKNSSLEAEITDAFEKATIKARYDILVDYKYGLLIDEAVDEEIADFEEDFPDEIKRPTSNPAPVDPLPTESIPEDVEPPAEDVEPPIEDELPQADEPEE